MEAASASHARRRIILEAALIAGIVLALRLPFLNQAIQGDDFYYLKGAEHALIDPLHPTHARYVFLGQMVDMRGHPHPPFDAWYLALFRTESEPALHAAFIPFSLIAAFSAWAIARRFGRRPLLATVLFLVTPAFVINGNSIESDLPFVAFWLAAIALFAYERYWLSAVAGVFAALAAYQAILLVPVLGWFVVMEKRRRLGAWVSTLAAPVTIAAWQIYERLTSGSLPAAVLAGYMQSYNLQAFATKLKSVAALTGHTAWLVFPVLALVAFWRGPRWVRVAAGVIAVAGACADLNPLFWISCGIGALVILSCAARPRDFLCWWVAVFFAAALIIFFAGSARYLLPIVVPVAIVVADRLNPRLVVAGAVAEAGLAVLLAIVNYQHWDGYRQFAQSLAPQIEQHRTWTNAEWGLRHYLEGEGAMPVENGRGFRPGDLIVTTSYFTPPSQGPAATIAERDITSPVPLRIVGLGTDSAYSSISFGLAPFGISLAPMDRVRAVLVPAYTPELSTLTIGTPEAARQIISGVYPDRWTSERATVTLKRPPDATQVEAKIFIPPQSPARTVRLYMDGKLLGQETYLETGRYTLTAPAPPAVVATVVLEVDKTFSVPGDQRRLGILLLSIGFR